MSMSSEGSSLLHQILGKMRIGPTESVHPLVTNIGRARREFKKTGTLRPQMVHIDSEDNLEMPALDLYFEPEGSQARPAFPLELQAAVAQLKPHSEGNDRLIVNYLPALDRIVWSPAINSDMNLLHAIAAISGENTVPDPQIDRYHLEIERNFINISTSNTESTRRFLAFLEATIPLRVQETPFRADIDLDNGRYISGVFSNIDRLREQLPELQ